MRSLVAVLVVVVATLHGLEPSRAAEDATDAAEIAKTQTLLAQVARQLGRMDERRFREVVLAGRSQYATAANDFRKGAARADRAVALCNLLSEEKRISGWAGTISSLTSNSAGDGVLSISIGDDVVVSTSSGGLLDIYGTVIHRGTALYDVLRTLSDGDHVEFGGRFVLSNEDCVLERSITQHGSMTTPVFIVEFDFLGLYRPDNP